jgi:hypothetical protein
METIQTEKPVERENGKRILLVEDIFTKTDGRYVAGRSVSEEDFPRYVDEELVRKQLDPCVRELKDTILAKYTEWGQRVSETETRVAEISPYEVFLSEKGLGTIPRYDEGFGRVMNGSFRVPKELGKRINDLTALTVKKAADSYFENNSSDKITIVSNIEEASEMIRNGQVDLVVTDLGLDTPESIKYSEKQGHGARTTSEFTKRNSGPVDLGSIPSEGFDRRSNGILVAQEAMSNETPHFIYTDASHFEGGIVACYLNNIISEDTYVKDIVDGKDSLHSMLTVLKPDGSELSPRMILEDKVCIGGKNSLRDFLGVINLAKELRLK